MKNQAKENKLEVKSINNKANIGCFKLISVKNIEIKKTIIEIKNHLKIQPLMYQIITECLDKGEVMISSIYFWNFAPKNELETFE